MATVPKRLNPIAANPWLRFMLLKRIGTDAQPQGVAVLLEIFVLQFVIVAVSALVVAAIIG